MNFDEYQEEARKTAIYPNQGSNIYYPTLLLAAEAGEIANKVQKIMRDKNDVVHVEDHQALLGEMGDVLWALAAMSTELGYDLSEVAQYNIEKLRGRAARGTIMGSGDNR